MLLKSPYGGMFCNCGLLIYLSYMVFGAIKNHNMKDQDINKDHLLYVHMVSTDHYILWAPDRLYLTKGKLDPSDMYS